ncbi:MAG: hypothetical protein JW915_23725 [Chitinispirillaceae bacterium]|nr:hypothetical protein [Chitinispirillaceae bacterium]
MEKIGICPELNDPLRKVHGIGGFEYVFEKCIDILIVDFFSLKDIPIQVGSMDYGYELNGIVGMDILEIASAILNVKNQEILFQIK